MPFHVSKQRFGELVERALEGLPEPFATHLEELTVEVKERPTARQLRQAGLSGDALLLGLYVGSPFTERSVMHSAQMPDKIYIFQEDVELASRNEAQLVEQVRITVLHEIGHHFGLGEDDLDALGYG